MGKQTNIGGSHFGGEWTKEKLSIIDNYLGAYSIALKNQRVKKVYIDGFAGSGKTELKSKNANENNDYFFQINENTPAQKDNDYLTIDGSALLSLKYNFDEYYFLELDTKRIEKLKENIQLSYSHKMEKVHFINGDCNQTLPNVLKKTTKYDRCLMFLDPYALELKWETLELIAKHENVDLWYLFPLSMLRLMEKSRNITDGNKQKITSILGTDDWFDQLFVPSSQISLFEDENFDRVDFIAILKYIKNRFSTIFPYVAPESKILRNEAKNSPLFMLCFMMTNKSEKAQKLASKLVKEICKTEKL